MIGFILRGLVAGLGFWIASRLMHGVRVSGTGSLIAAGLVLGVVNALVRPVLLILTFPLTLLTLGLFLLVVNGLAVWLVTVFVRGVRIEGLWHAILTAIVISLTSWAASGLIDSLTSSQRV